MKKFVDYIFDFFSWIGSLIADGFNALFNLLVSLFNGIFVFLDFIFYFFAQALTVIFLTLKIFIALFQYLFVISSMFLRAIFSFIIPHWEPYVMPESEYSNAGLNAFLKFIEPTGLVTVVPLILSCFVWFFFVMKVLKLFGGVRDE